MLVDMGACIHRDCVRHVERGLLSHLLDVMYVCAMIALCIPIVLSAYTYQ